MEKKEKQKLQFTNARDARHRMQKRGMSLVVQLLRFHVSSSEGTGSIPGWETKNLQAMRCVLLEKKGKGQKDQTQRRFKDSGRGQRRKKMLRSWL